MIEGKEARLAVDMASVFMRLSGIGTVDRREAGRISALDGIRAVSVLLVLFFHGTVPFFKIGFIGVDVFFVLSGFLITTVLVTEKDRTNNVSLLNFYRRRTLRLAPALAMMSFGFIAFAAVFLPSFTARLRETLEALLYVSNWSRAFKFGDSHYLGHTWSLGIEEQFYLFWPIVLTSVLRLPNGKKIAFWLALLLVAAAALWRLILTQQGASAARLYNGFDTRCDAVLAGCALAFVAPRLACYWPIGLAGLLGVPSFLAWNDPLFFEGGYTVIAISAMLVIAGALDERTSFARILSVRPLVAIGQRSYGLYLYHFPIYMIIIDKVGWNPLYLNTIGLGTTGILAALSYRYVELPCLQKGRQPYRSFRDLALACIGPISLAAGAIYILRFIR